MRWGSRRDETSLHIEEGSEKENGIGQLRCYMLKMSGTLALEAVKTLDGIVYKKISNIWTSYQPYIYNT